MPDSKRCLSLFCLFECSSIAIAFVKALLNGGGSNQILDEVAKAGYHNYIRKTTRLFLLILTLCAHGVFAQNSDLQRTIHEEVERHGSYSLTSEKWEAEKRSLSEYSQSQVVRALISEIDLDRNDQLQNSLRDSTIRDLFNSLNLPTTILCQELNESTSPQRKASLMFILRGAKNLKLRKHYCIRLKIVGQRWSLRA